MEKKTYQKSGPVIFCGNHRTYLDPQLIVVTAGREMRFLSKEELRKNPLLAFLGYIFNVIYVKRDSKDISALKEAIKTLKNGGCVGVFPEGTRNGLEKNEGKLKNGATYIAMKTGAKIIPIGIKGSSKLFSKSVIVYGKPIDYSQRMIENGEKDLVEKASEELKEEIIKLTKIDV